MAPNWKVGMSFWRCRIKLIDISSLRGRKWNSYPPQPKKGGKEKKSLFLKVLNLYRNIFWELLVGLITFSDSSDDAILSFLHQLHDHTAAHVLWVVTWNKSNDSNLLNKLKKKKEHDKKYICWSCIQFDHFPKFTSEQFGIAAVLEAALNGRCYLIEWDIFRFFIFKSAVLLNL